MRDDGTVRPTLTASLGSVAGRSVDEAVLLIGHGTRDREGADEFRAFAGDLAARLGDGLAVVPCFLELAMPSILGGVERCVALGARRVIAAPLFLFAANHIKNDVPSALNVARARYPEVEFCYGGPLGVQPELVEVVAARIGALESRLQPRPRAETAVLLVERGSSDPDANGQVFHLARLLWEGRGFGWVETCFIGITRPSLEDGLERCVRLGAQRVLVAPYFLFTGVLVRRIGRVVEAQRGRYPGVEFFISEHLGRHPALAELAIRRIGEAGRGDVRMSCDRCKYRVALVGFEHQVGQPQGSDHDHGLREHCDAPRGHEQDHHDGPGASHRH